MQLPQQIDFGEALATALVKKKVPVALVTGKDEADWVIQSTSAQQRDSGAVKAAKIANEGLLGVALGAMMGEGFERFEGTIQVVDVESSAVLFAYNVKKGKFKAAAEAFAKHFKSYLGKNR